MKEIIVSWLEIALIALCFGLIFHYSILEYRHKKSFSACWNRFNVLSLGCLLGEILTCFADVHYFGQFVDITSSSIVFRDFVWYGGAAITLSSYILYLYLRTDGLLHERWLRSTVRAALIVCVGVTIVTIPVVLWTSALSLPALILTVLSAAIIVLLDIVYTTVFVMTVMKTKKFFSELSETDIIMKYGLICVALSLLALCSYVVALLVDYGYIVITRAMQVCMGIAMVSMKTSLYSFALNAAKLETDLFMVSTTPPPQTSVDLESADIKKLENIV